MFWYTVGSCALYGYFCEARLLTSWSGFFLAGFFSVYCNENVVAKLASLQYAR